MPSSTLDSLLDRLEELKARFGAGDGARVLKLLEALARRRFPDAPSLIRFHEVLLFLRAYPQSPAVPRRADEILRRFAGLVDRLRAAGEDLSEFEEPEVSGIAGTTLSAVFSYGAARYLVERHPAAIDIDWEWYEHAGHMGRTLPRFLPLLEEDSLVEAIVPYREWFRSATGRRRGLAWLMERFAQLPLSHREKAELYDSLELLLRWEVKNSRATRSRMRIPVRKIFYHDGPLLRRRDISLEDELESPPLRVERLSKAAGEKILDLARDTSAVRYRELHGFTYGDPAGVMKADAGRGLEIYSMGARPEHRLPLRAYHGAIFFKNGVPVGYFEGLSLFERMEVGFNLYYTFREGESAWGFARILRLWRQLLGVSCFSIDPYQIGFHNEEAIASGAFWFYRKLGFWPVLPAQAALVGKEEDKLRRRPGYRTPARTLRRLAQSPLIFESPGEARGDWDRFQVRNLGMAVQRRMGERFGGDAVRMRRGASASLGRSLGVEPATWREPRRQGFENLALVLNLIPDLARWPEADKKAVVQIIRAKTGADESRYLRLMQRHRRLRAALQKLGS
jgi:hypothetical protein